MGPFGIKQIADALSLTVPQIQQWIARGFLTPEGEEGSGRRGRKWTFNDAVRAQICRNVVRSRIDSDQYRAAIEAATAAPEDCLLVITAPGGLDSHFGFYGHRVSYFDGREKVTWRIASANEVAELILARRSFRQITVIDISALVEETRVALDFREQSGGEATILTPPEEGRA